MNDAEDMSSESNVLYQNQLELQKQLEELLRLNQEQQQEIEFLKQQNKKRTLPQSELDLNLMLTDTTWSNLPPGLKERLIKNYVVINEKGERFVTKEDMSSLLGFYTRDLRLGNLNFVGGEIQFCEYHLDLANDFLKEGFIDPFLVCLSRVASKLELSQSRGGFLRKRHSSFTNENVSQNLDPPKRNIMGIKSEK